MWQIKWKPAGKTGGLAPSSKKAAAAAAESQGEKEWRAKTHEGRKFSDGLWLWVPIPFENKTEAAHELAVAKREQFHIASAHPKTAVYAHALQALKSAPCHSDRAS